MSVSSNDIVSWHLDEMNKALGKSRKSDVIAIRSPIARGLDYHICQRIEEIEPKKTKLSVMLETGGGSVEVTERIANVFRENYKYVEFIVPNYAFSAGTILCMSGDAILMNYFSVLGPIDPQVEADGKWIPGTGYLKKYDDFLKRSSEGRLTTAELAYFVKRFDQAELYWIEQAREQSKNLLVEWLAKYKFKDWKVTESTKTKVSQKMRETRAKQVADALNNVERWNSHGRGIPRSVLTSDELNLKIEDFGSDAELNDTIRRYYDLLIDFCAKIGAQNVTHTSNGLGSI